LRGLVPQLDAEVALLALNRGVGGWMPYAEDESKRARYRSYLAIRAGLRDDLPPKAPNASQDDWVNEMQEFARAAQVFKPVTGLMASRFTSSSTQPTSNADARGDSSSTDVLLTKPAAQPEDPAISAAKVGMFGPMTRSIENFYPTRLLCKRFNVKPPTYVQLDPGDGAAEQSSSAEHDNNRFRRGGYQYASNVDTLMSPNRLLTQGTGQSGGTSHIQLAANDIQPGREQSRIEAPVTVDPERNEALEQDRPGQAIFRAIFGNDDEDD